MSETRVPCRAVWHLGSDAPDWARSARSGQLGHLADPDRSAHRLLQAWSLDQVQPLLLEAWQAACRGAWVAGYVSFDAAPAFDPAFRVKDASPAATDHAVPLLCFLVAESEPIEPVSIKAVSPSPGSSPARDDFHFHAPWQATQTDPNLLSGIESVRQATAEGRYYQLNLTTALTARGTGDAQALLARLQRLQPDALSFLLETDAWAVLSASPELFFHWDGRDLVVQPMKGTASPSGDAAADRAALLASDKDRAENVMIVDLLRNDVSRVCEPGSVRTPSLFDVKTHPTVVQMTSTVQGRTRAGVGLLDVFRALFPCGSVTGAPKAETLSHIADLEAQRRGVYCGAVGLMLPGGACLFNVAIRTLVWNKSTQALRYSVGSGVTWYSDPAAELREWQVKAGLAHRVAQAFEVLETVRLADGLWHHEALHLDRLRNAAARFSYPFDPLLIERALQACAADHPTGQWRGRWLLHASGQFRVEIHGIDPVPAALTLQWASGAMQADAAFVRHKTTWRAHYDAHRPTVAAASDTLLWADGDVLLETLRGNIVLERDGQRWTPDAPLQLPGVFRQHLLQTHAIAQAPLRLADLLEARRVWVINSLRGWMPVATLVDGAGRVLQTWRVDGS